MSSNTVTTYIFFALACLFFLIAVFIHSEEKLPFTEEQLKEPESYFKGFMIVSSICIIISISFGLKKKSQIGTKETLLAGTGLCAVLAGVVIAWQKETSLLALSLTTLAGLLSAASLDTQ